MGNIKTYLKANWNANRERIILFADILGFKQMVLNSSHSDFLKIFRSFVERLKALMLPLQAGNHLRISIFSDTIVIGTDSCTVKNFNLIVKASAILMAVCHEFKWAINGCIACGNLTFEVPIMTQKEIEDYKRKKIVPFNVPILLGDAVISAYGVNSDLFCYGIVLHDNAIPLLEASNKMLDEKTRHPFYINPIPLRKDEIKDFNYLYWIDVPTHVNNKVVTLQQVLDWLDKSEVSQSERVKKYILNTRNILNDIAKNKNSNSIQ